VALKQVIGVDHAVVVVGDLDRAAENWQRLGFTLSPRGTHSAKLGTGNYTIMLDPDYLELLGVLTETEHNARPARSWRGGARASSASPSRRLTPLKAPTKFARAAMRPSVRPTSSGR
jgi:hypothetical protein